MNSDSRIASYCISSISMVNFRAIEHLENNVKGHFCTICHNFGTLKIRQNLIFTITNNLENFRRCLVSFLGYDKMMHTFYKIRKHLTKAEQNIVFYCKQEFPDEI